MALKANDYGCFDSNTSVPLMYTVAFIFIFVLGLAVIVIGSEESVIRKPVDV